jgi:hypothetical protein
MTLTRSKPTTATTYQGGVAKVADITRGLTAILDLCRQKAPRAIVILTAIFPLNDNMAAIPDIDQVNANLARLGALSAAGYRRCANTATSWALVRSCNDSMRDRNAARQQ